MFMVYIAIALVFSMCTHVETNMFCYKKISMELGKSTRNDVSNQIHIVYDTEGNDDFLEKQGIKSYYNIDDMTLRNGEKVASFVSLKFKKEILNSIELSFTSDTRLSDADIQQVLKCCDVAQLLKAGCLNHSNVAECLKQEKQNNRFTVKYQISLKD